MKIADLIKQFEKKFSSYRIARWKRPQSAIDADNKDKREWVYEISVFKEGTNPFKNHWTPRVMAYSLEEVLIKVHEELGGELNDKDSFA